jgi:hypothetical protein
MWPTKPFNPSKSLSLSLSPSLSHFLTMTHFLFPQLGGVAGGEKYIVNDVLFKFATDTAGIYAGGDIAAGKVAAHDLKVHIAI